MPLSTQDIQAACCAHLFRVRVGLLLVLLVQLVKLRADRKHLRVLGIRMAVCLIEQFRGIVALFQLVERHGLRVAAEHDIRTTAGHVGRDRDCARLARLRDDVGFLFVVLGVQHGVLDALGLEDLRQFLGLFDRHRADQDGLALGVAGLDAGDGRLDLAALVFVNRVRIVLTGNRLVGRDLDDVQLVGVAELLLLGQRGTGHAGQLAVQAEVVLEGDGGEGLALVLHLDAFLGLDGLVQALVIAAAEHQAAGELVDNDDLPVAHHIVHVALHDAARLDGLVDVMLEGGVLRVGQVLHAEVGLSVRLSLGGQGRGAGLFVDNVVRVDVVLLLLGVDLLDAQALEARGEAVCHLIQLGGLLALA